MQASTPTAVPSLQQVDASMAQAPVPVSQMLSVQQVEAQQAAQQLLQGQQQSPPPAADNGAFGSVIPFPSSSQHDSAEDDASSQVSATHCSLLCSAKNLGTQSDCFIMMASDTVVHSSVDPRHSGIHKK